MPCKPVNESYPTVTNIIDLKSWGLIAAIAIVASNLRRNPQCKFHLNFVSDRMHGLLFLEIYHRNIKSLEREEVVGSKVLFSPYWKRSTSQLVYP
jgi:hypothetical protein